MKSEAMHTAEPSDADLVAEILGGDRNAFGQIVERYQTLIASLAYCATGNVSQSEDLAQETFVTAWKQLAELREPAKLRPWLCSITRFLISKQLRRQGREPIHEAQSLDELDDWTSPEPLPPDHAISQEELSLLWRSLERIPPSYREPLVLFYREHQSIEAVAKDLGLSEDAVKQRLSRGRKFLQEQFMAFVAGALDQTRPGKTFAVGVLAALPLLATAAKGTTVGTALAKHSSVAAKATSSGGFLQAISNAVMGIVYWLAAFLPLGGYIGYKMGGDRQNSERARRSVATFWRIMGVSMFLFVVLPPALLYFSWNIPHVSHSRVYAAQGLWQELLAPILMYAVVPLSLIIWIWQRRRKVGPETARTRQVSNQAGKPFTIWIVMAMTGAILYLGYFFWIYDSVLKHVPKSQFVSTAEVQKLIAEPAGRKMEFFLARYENGFRDLNVAVHENGRLSWLIAPADDTTLALLAEKGIAYKTAVQNQDFTDESAAGMLITPFCFFIIAAGMVTLLRRRSQKQFESNPIAVRCNESRVDRAFAALAACGMLAAAILLGLRTDWKVSRVSAKQVPGIIAQHKNARFEVFEYPDGSRKLWISDRRTPDFIAPANESTLRTLTREGITYQTYVAGRAGLPGHSQFSSALWILALTTGAGSLFWWAVKSRPISPPRIQAPATI